MSIWDGQITLQRAFRGPSLFGPCSGALVTMTVSPQLADWLSARPAEEGLRIWEDCCESVLGKVIPATAAAQAVSHVCWTHHLLSLNDALRLHYCIDQSPARLISLSRERVMIFVPCDDTTLGVQVTALSAEMLFNLLSPLQTGAALKLRAPDPDKWSALWRNRVRTWREGAEALALNVNARWVAREALAQGIPYYRLPGSKSLLQLGQGAHQHRLNGAVTDTINTVAFQWSQDKWQTSALFAKHGLPTTQPRLVANIEQAIAEAARLGGPVVIKPRSTNKGVGITVNIQHESALRGAFDDAAKFRTGVLLERYVEGYDHRLLVVGGRFIAAVRRRPAEIQGDGERTIAELVEALNLARFRAHAPGVYLPLVRVELDSEALRVLNAAGHGPQDILPAGVIVALRGHANLSTGGVSEDITPSVHPDNRELAEYAARLIGLTTAGLDLQTSDITRSWREVGGAILEINAGPALWVHQPRTADYDIPKAVLNSLFPAGATGRVLTAGVTGSLGKTTTCRMLARILTHHGHTVALTTTQGAFIGDHPCRTGDLAGGGAALTMLQDTSVTASVAELARGGLIKRGLGFDVLDVGAVLNVLDNHVGLDGVQSREQMAKVKQLVVRYARKLAVLNADDPLCLLMSAEIDPDKLCLVGESGNPQLAGHAAAGGMIATIRESTQGALLSLQLGQTIIGEMPMAAIPATWGGTFRPPMINALFSAAMAYGLGVPFRTIQHALTGFASDYRDNPGRMNRITGLPFELWLSWLDGPQALTELRNFITNHSKSERKSLVFYAMGNRPDAFIRDSAVAVAGAFDHYFCTDMEEDRRGRDIGEVASLLAAALSQAGVADSCIVTEPSTTQAIEAALRAMPAGGTLVIGSYHPEKVMATVRSLWPELA